MSERTKARELISAGAELAGGAVSVALGLLASGGAASVLLGVSGVAITRALTDAADKYMTKREQARVGSVSAMTLARMQRHLSHGDKPRVDIFTSDNGTSSSGVELLEGLLLKARDEYEQRKLPYLAAFYANVVFSDVAPSVAFKLLKTLESLSYRQVVLISLVQREGHIDMRFIRATESHDDMELESLKREEMDLHANDLGSLGLLEGYGKLGYEDQLSNLGRLLASLADFETVPREDQDALLDLLTPPGLQSGGV